MTKSYMMLSEGMLSTANCWKSILNSINYLIFDLTFAVDLKQIRQDIAVSIGSEVIDLKKLLARELAKNSDIKPGTPLK